MSLSKLAEFDPHFQVQARFNQMFKESILRSRDMVSTSKKKVREQDLREKWQT